MSDYLSIPTIAGALGTEWVGDAGDIQVLDVQEDRIVESFWVGLYDTGATDVIVEIRDAVAGGGQSMQVTIPGGSEQSNTATSPFTILAGSKLYLRVVQTASGAGGLYGTVGLNSVGTGVGIGVVGPELTTDSLILAMDPKLSVVSTTVRDTVRLGVSQRMTTRMGRVINQQLAKTRRYQTTPASHQIRLEQYPVVVSEAKFNLDLMDAATYSVDDEKGIFTMLNEGLPVNFKHGWLDVTADEGYALVPPSLVEASTKQCAKELYMQDKRLIAITRRIAQSGVTDELQKDGWLISVREAMDGFIGWASP